MCQCFWCVSGFYISYGCVYLNICMSNFLVMFQGLRILVSQGSCVPMSLYSGVCDFSCVLRSSICMSLVLCKSVSFVSNSLCILVLYILLVSVFQCLYIPISGYPWISVFLFFHVFVSVCPGFLCFSACASFSLNVLEFLHSLSLCDLVSVYPCLSVHMDFCISVWASS